MGLVEEGKTLGRPAILMMSGAWPPPDPSVWNECTVRPSNASIVVVNESGFVQRVGVDADLHVHLVRDGERGAKYRRRGAPVLVALHADCAGLDLLDERCLAMSMPLAENADVDRPAFERAQHHRDVAGAGRNCGRVGAVRRTRSAADQGGGAVGKRRLRLLRRNEMDVRVDCLPPSGSDESLRWRQSPDRLPGRA